MVHSVRWSRRAALLAGGLLVTGCSGYRRPTIQSEDYDSAGSDKKHLREILERRAKALMDKDEKGYLADLDQSNKKLVQHEKLIFDNLRQFDLAEIRFITERAIENTDDDGDVQFAPVIRITKFTADAGPGDVAPAETFLYRLRKKNDKFVVTGIIGATRKNYKKLHLDGPLAYGPWNTDKLHVVKVGKKVWLVGDKSVTDLDRYAAVTERELRLVENLWGDRLTYPGYILFFTRDMANLKQWFDYGAADDFDPSILGLQWGLLGVQKNGTVYGREYAASRIVVNLKGHQAYSDPAMTIRHELTHAVTARASLTIGGDYTPPTWAIEGFARYTETMGNAASAARIRSAVATGVRAGKFRGTTPASKNFYDFGGDIDFNYCLGSTVFSLAERLKGRAAAVELYYRIIQHPDSLDMPFMRLPVFDGISRDVLGMSSDAFRSRWNTFVRNGG
ncbi:hypothetical protein [Sphaerimonospora thailandensis]|uniref:Lipoprotein n=1 Tax=Sphaerimonospora thailandensis TaxID=795644 RepID=A0A8J3REP6_9ACTN|nr:hypothetical protein [Sphaerimonospora thailandensis]GIH72462.1 hypothetical protein Mth01_47150 [Sphaerimonospora thailandensis]